MRPDEQQVTPVEEQFTPPTPTVTPQTSITPKPQKGGKVLIYCVVVTVITALLSGGVVWGYMNNQNSNSAKTLKSQITSKDSRIKSLQSEISTLQTETPSGSTTIVSTNTDMFKSLTAFCGSDDMTVDGATLTTKAYDGGTSGAYYGSCNISAKGALTGGGILFARYVNNAWQKVYTGNGMAPDSTCVQYKVPRELHMCESR